jgi:hypothetical protein
MSVGEEELLALFFDNLNKDGLHGFESLQQFNAIVTQEGTLAEYVASSAFHSKKQADKVSYIWDQLIEQLFKNLRPIEGENLPWSKRVLLAKLADVNRVQRRLLGESIGQVVKLAKEPGRFVRALRPSSHSHPMWIFMALKRPTNISFEEYVEVRQAMLWSYVLAARYLYDAPTEVVGIGLNAWGDAPTSEDILLLPIDDWSDELREEGKRAHECDGFLKRAKLRNYSWSEYPDSSRRPTRKVGNRQRSVQVGRNNQCPCGSGLKYKKCCGLRGRFR